MKENREKLGILEKMELISAIIYLITGKILHAFAGRGISTLILGILMIIFTVLLVIFIKHHFYYRQNKPLLTILSIYYKSLVYVVIIFTVSNYPGKDALTIVAWVSTLVYMILAYINGKQNSEILNAYMYLSMVCIAGAALFFPF